MAKTISKSTKKSAAKATNVAKAPTKKTVSKKTTVKKNAHKKAPSKKTTATKAKARKPAAGTAKRRTAVTRPPGDKTTHISANKRRQMISEAAYLRGEAHGFLSDEREDWLLAEAEIDTVLTKARVEVTG